MDMMMIAKGARAPTVQPTVGELQKVRLRSGNVDCLLAGNCGCGRGVLISSWPGTALAVPMTRRSVAKHRSELGIPSIRERRVAAAPKAFTA